MAKEKFQKLNPTKFALSLAGLWATSIFIISISAYFNFFGGPSLITLILLDIYGRYGYSISFFGSVLGAIYSFIDVFIFTWLFVWIYNKIL